MKDKKQDNSSTIDFTKKKLLYEKLGALKFQKIVFKIEKIKFKLIDKFCPNIYIKYNNWCDKKVNKLCSKNISEEEKNRIRFVYNCRKISFKRELLEKKNVNYHFKNNNASEFYKYLNWNKKVHQKGMINDVIGIILSVLGICLFSNFFFIASIISLIYNAISLVIDFECVNLQNYNICRFEEKKHILARLEKRSLERDLQKYSDVSKKIYNELSSSTKLPQGEEIVSKLTTLEEIRQLRQLALEIKNKRSYENNEEENKEKIKK